MDCICCLFFFDQKSRKEIFFSNYWISKTFCLNLKMKSVKKNLSKSDPNCDYPLIWAKFRSTQLLTLETQKYACRLIWWRRIQKWSQFLEKFKIWPQTVTSLSPNLGKMGQNTIPYHVCFRDLGIFFPHFSLSLSFLETQMLWIVCKWTWILLLDFFIILTSGAEAPHCVRIRESGIFDPFYPTLDLVGNS